MCYARLQAKGGDVQRRESYYDALSTVEAPEQKGAQAALEAHKPTFLPTILSLDELRTPRVEVRKAVWMCMAIGFMILSAVLVVVLAIVIGRTPQAPTSGESLVQTRPAKPQPIPVKFTVWHEGLSGFIETNRGNILVSSCSYAIRNDDVNHVVIQKVTYNGEFEANRARRVQSRPGDPSQIFVSDRMLPAELTIGQSAYLFHQDNGYKVGNYDKDVIFMDIQTNLGTFRFRRGTKQTGITGQPDWVLANE